MLKQKYAKSHCMQMTQSGGLVFNRDSPMKLVSKDIPNSIIGSYVSLYINLYAIGPLVYII